MPPKIRQSRRLTFPERLVWLLVTLLAVRTWVFDGFPVLCQVTGSSMAETLLGAHYAIVCDDCGFSFACEATVPALEGQVVCPNCGHECRMDTPLMDLAGDRVVIDKSAFLFRMPRRWEVVAFRRPGQGNVLVAKRVIGLPGETVRIHQGDVYVNGEIARKTLRQQRALRVLVHDAAFRPQVELSSLPRWHAAESEESLWNWADGRYAHPFATGKTAATAIDWLLFSYPPAADRSGAVRAGPVTDLSRYNQGRPRREEDVHSVADVMLSVRIAEVSGQGPLWLRSTDGCEEFQTQIDPVGQSFAVLQNGRPVPSASGRLPSSLSGMTVEMSLVDRQFLLALDGHTVATVPLGTAARSPGGTRRVPEVPLAIGSQGLGVVLADLRVYRDVYYGLPWSQRAAAALENGVVLSENEFFVLGDNSSISEDSRTWSEDRAVTAEQLVGRPLFVVFSARELSLGRRHFQVPDLRQIRYIR